MKKRTAPRPGVPPELNGDVAEVDVSLRSANPGDSPDAMDGAELLRILEGNHDLPPDPVGTAQTPKVRRMPEGIEVVERSVGRADGQWVLRVRCQCGRSWFEVDHVHWATCPRCNLLVHVRIEKPTPQ